MESVLLGTSSRRPLGTNVFSREWDLLIVLDACRYDAIAGLAPEFDPVNDVNWIYSVGSSTREWAANTFTAQHRELIRRTAVVCSNAQVPRTLEAGNAMESPLAGRVTSWETVGPDAFHTFDAVSDYAPMDPHGGTSLPGIATDRAIRVGRETDADRLLVHYLPPHSPFRATALRENRPLERYEYRPFDYLRAGGDRDRVWERYLDELRWGLDEVERLLDNVDAERAVITADHGELFGHLGLYSHPTGVPHPRLRRVPWLETTAVDTGEYEPSYEKPDRTHTTEETAKQLEYLGYR
ncbi:hypothetical protein B4589_016250 (plasmid) [Halolamina sp. CBA1230]|uniref:hypothetical protein n=1 Tax=Halolamina sp. CBA1230 TaxID=1853690 RepID=UPI0009A13E4C|nr:hypothetical protein [Halolamina sp. CBA1230]QKY21963.1 hypothetical protein B4589_016250 [Halolamina sp. CBA1230]